ncbi:MAG: hypothetical protein IJU52_01960 [Clostridia bacterium]|nr:hypothetical protein [Clostridia bacterium]
MNGPHNEDEYKLIQGTGAGAGTSVSPTGIDEKDDVADDGSRTSPTAGEQMVIVNPIGKGDVGYTAFVGDMTVSPDEDEDDGLTPEEREALERLNAPTVERDEFSVGEDINEELGEIDGQAAEFYAAIGKSYLSYPETLAEMQDGDFTLELRKRYMLKAIDEEWIKAIEDHLTALDTIIRSPTRFIEQNEQLLPIELSRRINNRSIQHLCQHTNLINKVEGDEITPSKILNVFNDETMLTYENKFINTLVNRLYFFIAKRYQAAVKSGKDEKCTMLSFGGRFTSGKVKGKVNINLELSEEPEENVQLKNYYFTTELWFRVERLLKIVQGYMSSDFVTSMGKAYIRPPVMRTNAILKNKNMRQCLELWEFVESYENVGYEMLIQEDKEDVREEYKRRLYNDAALQFLIFRYQIKNDFDAEQMLSAASTDEPLSPKIVSKIEPFKASEFNVFDSIYQRMVPAKDLHTPTPAESSADIENAIDVALAASEIYEEQKRAEIARRKAEEERRRAEEERKRLEEEERKRREEEERKRREEEERKAEEARLAAEAEAKRLAEEEAARLAAEEEARRIREEEEARILREEEARLAEEERQKKEEEERRASEIAARIAAAEEKRRAEEEAKRKLEEEAKKEAEELGIRDRKLPRKKKKKVRRAAETKAEGEGVELAETFNYVEYMRYLKK